MGRKKSSVSTYAFIVENDQFWIKPMRCRKWVSHKECTTMIMMKNMPQSYALSVPRDNTDKSNAQNG